MVTSFVCANDFEVSDTRSADALVLLRIDSITLDEVNTGNVRDKVEDVESTITEDCAIDSVNDIDILNVLETESVDDLPLLLEVEENTFAVADTVGVTVIEDCVIDSVNDIDVVDLRDTKSVGDLLAVDVSTLDVIDTVGIICS